WPILIFMGLAWLSLINAPNTERSIVVLTFTAFTILVSLFLPNILTSEAKLKTMLTVIIIGMGVTCAFGIYQFAGDLAGLPTSLTGLRDLYTKDILGFPRIQSTALEPLYFANYLLLPLSLLLTLFLKKHSPFSRNVSIVLLLLAGINFVLTVSRGGYIAGAVSVLFIAAFTLRQLFTLRNLVTVAVIVVLVGGISVRFLNQGEALEKFVVHAQNIFGGASYSERVETYEIAYRAILEHPLLGIGMGSFGPYASYHPYVVPSQGYQIVNNEYLELAAENGILGLVAFVVILVTLAVRTVKAYRQTQSSWLKSVIIGLSAALIGILIQYNTFSILYIMHVWVTLGLLMCVQQLILNRHESVQ
ncbi:MAG: O-antigen ligase family protein, partial [Patescibacteria group bacterium]